MRAREPPAPQTRFAAIDSRPFHRRPRLPCRKAKEFFSHSRPLLRKTGEPWTGRLVWLMSYPGPCATNDEDQGLPTKDVGQRPPAGVPVSKVSE